MARNPYLRTSKGRDPPTSGLRRLRPSDAWGPDFTRPRWIDGREFEQADKRKRRTPGGPIGKNSHATRTLAERSAPPGVFSSGRGDGRLAVEPGDRVIQNKP